MELNPGDIIKNLISTELVKINSVKNLGNNISIEFEGRNSRKTNKRIISKSDLEKLILVSQEGVFNFKGKPEHFLLYAEAERIHSAFQFDPLFAVNCSIVDPLPHQIDAVYKYLLPQPRIRFLLADDTGAGKTIMAGLLLKELMMRGLIERILIITPGGLTRQWLEDEMKVKFNISFKLVNRATFQAEPTVFSNSDRIITSIDFLRNEDILNVVKETPWDIIVVDEAHKLTAFDYGKKQYVSKRYDALENLAYKCEHLLLLTATPHRGRSDTFRHLLRLLDREIFASDELVGARIQEVEENGINKFFIRRLKENMKDWDGNALYKKRYTRTICYDLTPEEKRLYDKVTEYLTEKRKEAKEESNIHVSLALMVMQRRLTSSIHAILKTLKNRYSALKSLIEELDKNPDLWKQKQKLDNMVNSLYEYDEMGDDERETLENLVQDPKKFKLFTTAKSPADIRIEAAQVKDLVEIAQALRDSNQEEQKFKKLRELLKSEGILHKDDKLVIFTEHRDTLDYLEERLNNDGYTIATIHGGKSVDERREAQFLFKNTAQILIATDAAGEGINLQFCRLLLNWDIPWNPNRLEQRMGRIHRYGQEKDVLVCNLVAGNTREGNVLETLLNKLEKIREQLGDDRVYDVISDIFEDIDLDEIFRATFNGEENAYTLALEKSLTRENIFEKIKEQKMSVATSTVDYKDAQRLRDISDERRLQPIYIRIFFEKAFKQLGGSYHEIKPNVFAIDTYPNALVQILKTDYNISPHNSQVLFCFDKNIFLQYQDIGSREKIQYINPGNTYFDSLVKLVLRTYTEDMLMGTVLISPDDKEDFFAYYIRSQIIDERIHKDQEMVIDEILYLVASSIPSSHFGITSPARFIDLHPPSSLAQVVVPPESINSESVEEWCLSNITNLQLESARERVTGDTEKRKKYIEEAFNASVFEINREINEMQKKLLNGQKNLEESIRLKRELIDTLIARKEERLHKLEAMLKLHIKPPEILGCAYVRALTKVEYHSVYGMSRDDEVEAIAMRMAMDYECEQGRTPSDVSAENAGYDIRSIDPDGFKRYIEVKGRSSEDGVMLSENEMNRLEQLGKHAWLYIIVNCATTPTLYAFQDPANKKNFKYELISKGIQYYLPLNEWKKKLHE